MIYSVWNQGTGRYDYYQTAEVQKVVNTPAPKHLNGVRATLGVSPIRASWPLPAGAVKIGSGEYAQGRLASTSTDRNRAGLGDFPVVGDLGFIAMIAVGALVLTQWKAWKTYPGRLVRW